MIIPSYYWSSCFQALFLEQTFSIFTTIQCEANGKIVDEQNGFRESRSTIDQVSTLTNIIDSRKKRKLSTFCAFIDFRKAYDCINRDILWAKLDSIGVSGKLFNAVKSLYASVASCVRINNLTTDWFDVSCGLRQGCCLSPLLFNLFYQWCCCPH